jgi:hypothetical protein
MVKNPKFDLSGEGVMMIERLGQDLTLITMKRPKPNDRIKIDVEFKEKSRKIKEKEINFDIFKNLKFN